MRPMLLSLLLGLCALAFCESSKPRTEAVNALLQAQTSRRAAAYLKNAQEHFKNYERTLNQDGDVFMHCWAAAQQLMAAVEYNKYRDPSLSIEAIRIAGVLLDSPEGHVIKPVDLVEWATNTAIAHPESKPQLRERLLALKDAEMSSKELKQVRQLANLLQGNKPQQPIRSGYTPGNWVLENPQPPKCFGDAEDCGNHTSEIQLVSHALFPSTVSTLRAPLTVAQRELLSEKAIAKFKEFGKKRNDYGQGTNNAFFQWQPKGEYFSKGKPKAWPELYQSEEYQALRDAAKRACIEHAMSTGQAQDRAELEAMDLVLWAAVYLDGTSHSTHVHEQAACSGVFYSQVAEEAPTPIEFSDPRGLSSMWIDTTQSEKEPLAPFHNRISFFPKAGDMVLFPSYLPHRIESHQASTTRGARVAWAFNLEGGVDTWARVVTATPPQPK